MAVSKVVYGGKTLIDLTGDTVTEDKLLKGATAHGKDGEPVTGACTFDVDSNFKRQDRLCKRKEIRWNNAEQWSGTRRDLEQRR